MFGWFKKKTPAVEVVQKPKDLASAISLHLAGDLEGANAAYRDLLEQNPAKAAPAFLLATALVQLGKLDDAVALLDDLAQHAGAFAAETRAAVAGDTRPRLVEAILAAGDLLKAAGRLDLSCAWYQAATELDPNSAEALYRYGDTMHDQRLYSEAERALQGALVLDPNHWGSCYTYGVLLQDLGRDAEAIGYYERAVRVRDDHAKLHNNLGSALLNIGRTADALPRFQRAVQLDGTLAQAHSNLGTVYHLLGLWRHSLAAFENAIAVGAPAGIRVKQALVLPPVPASKAEIAEARTRMQRELTALTAANLTLRDPVREVGVTPLYLAFHGEDDLPLMRQLASFYASACRQLNYVARHCLKNDGKAGAERKIRVGFVSASLRGNAVGRLFNQVIRQLSRDRFEVVAVSTFTDRDDITLSIEQAAEKATVPMLLATAQQTVEDAKLDVLVYPDIGIDPLTYFLGFARLAPVQIALFGHPDTTGIPNIDFFVTHEACEPPDAAEKYSERLLYLSGEVSFTYFDRPVAAAAPKTRDDFHLDHAAHLYLCPQSLHKIHPDMDEIFVGILERDPDALLILPKAEQPEWNDILQERLAKAGANLERILFLPTIALGDFHEVVRLSDVVLDSVHLCDAVNTLDALAIGTPVVTLPGAFMRGRLTAGCYRLMGIDDCVADTTAAYVDKAVALGCDAKLRAEVSGRILEAAPRLFEDAGMIREFEALLERAVQGAARR